MKWFSGIPYLDAYLLTYQWRHVMFGVCITIKKYKSLLFLKEIDWTVDFIIQTLFIVQMPIIYLFL